MSPPMSSPRSFGTPLATHPFPGLPAYSRRALLVGAASTGATLLLAGCTDDSADDDAPPLTAAQADQLAEQVSVTEAVVTAYAAAARADPDVGGSVTVQAQQAQDQLDRMRAAAPSTSSATPSAGDAPPAGGDVRGWLRAQVGSAADALEDACADQSGPRAALLGAIAAGLRGQEAVLE